MAGSLDELMRFLLDEIALSGQFGEFKAPLFPFFKLPRHAEAMRSATLRHKSKLRLLNLVSFGTS
jgi:hypothetical protein